MTKKQKTTSSIDQQAQPRRPPKDLNTTSFRSLFRFASKQDYILMLIGAIGAAIDGAAMPFIGLLTGDVADSFTPGSSEDIIDVAGTTALRFAIVGIIGFVGSYLGFACWISIGEKQSIEIRKRYFKSLLSQEIAFYDSINPNELS